MASETPHRPVTDALGTFAATAGKLYAVAANRPVHLDEPDVTWLVEDGVLDISVAVYGDTGLQSSFKHLLRLEAGRPGV